MSTHNSLTAKWDITDTESKVVGSEYGVAVLTEDEVKYAKEELLDKELLSKFRQQDKFYSDPIYNNQLYSLHSFIPTKGAKPDEHGVFGFMKCRGTFFTQEEADQRAEWIIRNVDSYHTIQTSYTGKPFPICADTKKYVQDTNAVDIRKKATETISQDIKDKRYEEKRTMQEIKEKEKKLLESTGEDFKEDIEDVYTTLMVKKANLIWTYVETRDKMKQMRENIIKTRKEINDMDKEDSSLKEQYYERYMQARKESGLSEEVTNDNFMKFLVSDKEADLDF